MNDRDFTCCLNKFNNNDEITRLKEEIESLKTAYNELFDDKSETVKDLRNDLEWASSNLPWWDHCQAIQDKHKEIRTKHNLGK